MTYKITDIADSIGATLVGDTELTVSRLRHPKDASEKTDLAVAMEKSFLNILKDSNAEVAVLAANTDWQNYGLKAAILVTRPRFAMAGLTHIFQHPIDISAEIHSSAVIEENVKIGTNVSIGAFCIIGKNTVIGDNTQILSHTSIGSDCEIGANGLIHAGCRIGARVTIGHSVILQPNANIAADGFSFVTPEKGSVEAAKQTGEITTQTLNTVFARIHSVGSVTIGDNVEIGASTTIDRGTLQNTTIGSGTKIDNQVQIGHNVTIGENCLLCAQVGIAGSAVIGDRVVLGGKVGVADHIKISSDSVVGAASNVATKVPPRSIMLGSPAAPRDKTVASLMALRRLPKALDTISDLEKSLKNITDSE